MAVCLRAHILLRQETLFVRTTGAVAILFRALAACVWPLPRLTMHCECRRHLVGPGNVAEHTPVPSEKSIRPGFAS